MRRAGKADLYDALTGELAALLGGERDFTANAANCVALLYDRLSDLNWAGVYVLREEELVLGPFQGKPACVRIPVGKGVCGSAARIKKAIVVEDVRRFPGHIACDPASRSEIVLPLVQAGELIGVLDLDSPVAARFDDADRAGLEAVVALFVSRVDPPR